MKRRDLLAHLAQHSCALLREGAPLLVAQTTHRRRMFAICDISRMARISTAIPRRSC